MVGDEFADDCNITNYKDEIAGIVSRGDLVHDRTRLIADIDDFESAVVELVGKAVGLMCRMQAILNMVSSIGIQAYIIISGGIGLMARLKAFKRGVQGLAGPGTHSQSTASGACRRVGRCGLGWWY